MTPEEYRAEAMRTECDQDAALTRLWKGSHPNEEIHLVRLTHAVLGMGNELGEVGSLLQKAVYYGVPFTPEELRRKLCDELGDLFWHFNQALTAAGLTLDEVTGANVRKLRIRFPKKFDLARRLSRDQDAEEKAWLNLCSFCGDPSCDGRHNPGD